MKNQQVYENIRKYAAELYANGYLRSGFVGVSADEGLYITTPEADFEDLKEDQVAFVTEKGIEQIDGNFRAAAVLLICALKAKKKAGAAAIVDSEHILAFSARRKTLPPVLDDMAQIDGVSVRTALKNGTYSRRGLHRNVGARQGGDLLYSRRAQGRSEASQRD